MTSTLSLEIFMDVKTLCLGALTLGDATGYEIRKLFEEGPFAHFYDASYGSIYPALGRLLSEGLVDVTEMAQDGRPDKKIYRLTADGLDVFKAALAEPPTRDKIRSENIARLFFAEYMEEESLRAVYENYLREFKDIASKLRSLDDTCSSASRKFTRGMGLAFYESVSEYMEQNRQEFFRSVKQQDRIKMNHQLVGVGDDD
jgi:PadR family transcriptional regulator, regulatory protein AphA